MVRGEQKGKLPKNENDLSVLVSLFRSIGITEKGIEEIYHYLLLNGMIEDPKIIKQISPELSLKRFYKVVGVLKDLGLVQVFGRPMKVILKPPKDSWEKLINEKINEINQEAEQRISECKEAYTNLIKHYGYEEQSKLSPVEFYSITSDEDLIDFITGEFIASDLIRNAKSTPFLLENSLKKNFMENVIENKRDCQLKEYFLKYFLKFRNIKVEVIVSEEYVNEKVERLSEWVEHNSLDMNCWERYRSLYNFENTTIRVIQKEISNFTIRDDRTLLQYTISPDNYLIGFYITEHNEVVNVFINKFTEFFNEGMDITEFFKKNYGREPTLVELFTIIFL